MCVDLIRPARSTADRCSPQRVMPPRVSMEICLRSTGLTQPQPPVVMFTLCSCTEGSRMSGISYHVVVTFGVGKDGTLAPVFEEAAATPHEAVLLARRLANAYAGAVAFSRTMDVGNGRYGVAKVHAVEGLIPNDLAPMCARRPPPKRQPGGPSPSRRTPRPQSREPSTWPRLALSPP